MKQFILFTCLLALGATACSDDNPTEPSTQSIVDDMTLVYDSEVDGIRLQMYSQTANILAGYNEFVFTIAQGGSPAELEHLHVHPIMTMMGGMQHGTPSGYFEETAEEGVYKYSIVFSMPSQHDSSWMLSVEPHLSSHETAEFTFPVMVENGGNVVVLRKDEVKLIASLVDQQWQVGKQQFDLYVFEENHHMYEPLSFSQLEFYPWMGSMGHGSDGNEQPIEMRDGEYSGAVNFSMTGPWQMHFVVHEGAFAGYTVTFDVDVQ